MIRRTFLQMLLASPLLGLLKKKDKPEVQMDIGDMSGDSTFTFGKPPYHIQIAETTGTSSGRFWMQTYGPYSNPQDIDPHWNTEASSLLGVHSGTVLDGVKASEYEVGSILFVDDWYGRHYVCYELNERTYMKEGLKGVFLRGVGN